MHEFTTQFCFESLILPFWPMRQCDCCEYSETVKLSAVVLMLAKAIALARCYAIANSVRTCRLETPARVAFAPQQHLDACGTNRLHNEEQRVRHVNLRAICTNTWIELDCISLHLLPDRSSACYSASMSLCTVTQLFDYCVCFAVLERQRSLRALLMIRNKLNLMYRTTIYSAYIIIRRRNIYVYYRGVERHSLTSCY